MKLYLKLIIGMFFVFTLTGCFGEDYDVGVPTAYLEVGQVDRQLTEANINWETQSENVQETIADIQEFALSQSEINVSANQEATLDFKENENNGGDIWTDPKITAVLLSDEEQIDIDLNESRSFTFPSTKGNYMLKVEFESHAGLAQYVGNNLVQPKQ